MTSRKALLAAIASVALAACAPGSFFGGPDQTGDDDGMNPPPPPPADAGPTGSAARQQFEDTVAPILAAKCGTAGCHAGVGNSPLKFMPDTGSFYDVVVSYDDRVVGYFDKTTAPIITKIDPGPHYATYTPEEKQAIADWLDAELAERNGGQLPPPTQPTPGQVSKQLIAEWSGCLELVAVQEENVNDEWAALGSSEGPCIRCHVNGQASFIATDDDQRWFDVVTTNKYYLLTYFAADVTDLANARMVINYEEFLRVGTSQYPFLEHPQFEPSDNEAIRALERLYDRTMARKAAGTCDPPRIVDP